MLQNDPVWCRLSSLEVATTISEAENPIDLSRRCVSDPRRSLRQLHNRLETWIARFAWEAHHERRFLEAELLLEHLHYLIHLRKKKRESCPRCTVWVRSQLEKR
jgi:hypothetical protein